MPAMIFRSWLNTALLFALLFRAALPFGTMPEQRDGLPVLVMCSDGHRGWQSPLPASVEAADTAESKPACSFAGLLSGLAPLTSFSLDLPDVVDAVIGSWPPVLSSQRRWALRPPTRAPPLFS